MYVLEQNQEFSPDESKPYCKSQEEDTSGGGFEGENDSYEGGFEGEDARFT